MIIARRFSGFCFLRRFAHFVASLATVSTLSGFVTYRCNRLVCREVCTLEVVSSLNEKGTDIIRPSNSGRATFIAVSMGPRPRSLSRHSC